MPGNRLTLSTDDGEQADEENDRMAPHHLFHLPSRLEAIFSTRPSSSSSSLFSLLAARVETGPLSPHATKTRTHCYYVLLVLRASFLFFLAIHLSPRAISGLSRVPITRWYFLGTARDSIAV